MGLMIAFGSKAQFIDGSIKKGTGYNQVDILFKPTFTSNVNEYINYVQFSLTIPSSAYTAGVIATLTPVGNFATLSFAQSAQYTQASTSERVFTWICTNLPATTMSWTNGVAFTGATVTFTGGPNNTQVKMADYTNAGGGSNANTYFVITCTQHGPSGDVTHYGSLFYATTGVSTTGTYGNGDEWVRTVPTVSLPIDLLTFSGYKDGTRNQLKWITSTEQNNHGFEVQRSLDGINYTAIGFINSLAIGGNSYLQLNYTFTDNNVTSSKQFYRLKQVDINGNNKISNVILIKGDKPTLITLNGIFPNPATTVVNLLVGSPAKDQISMLVTDISGRVVIQRTLNVEMGSNTLPVNITALAGGTYMVKIISSDGEVSSGKFVKQ